MKRKNIILLFVFLSSISLIWLVANGESDPNDSNGDKIKEVVSSGIKNVSDKVKKAGLLL